MSRPGWLLFASSVVPLLAATRANRHMSLVHSVGWAWAAWLIWAAALALGGRVWGYAALCLTGCAGVAVLGARRPGAAAERVRPPVVGVPRPLWRGLGPAAARAVQPGGRQRGLGRGARLARVAGRRG